MCLKKIRRIPRGSSGQALVEYALILVMVAILFAVTLAATGPAIGNVFSNAVYNLIGGNPEDFQNRINTGPGLSENFWATVAWLEDHPPEERAIALNNPLPPPPPPTEGPTPTSTPISPTPAPTNTQTATASATPRDKQHVAPWLDMINTPDWWRVDSSVWLGSDQFHGDYFGNASLNGNPAYQLWHGELGIDQKDLININFNWPSGSGPIGGGFATDNWSVRWTRQLYVPAQPAQPLQVNFTVTTGGGQDGARLWLYPRDGGTDPQAGCSSVASGGGATGTAATYADGQSPSGSATDCLLIDAWRDNAESLNVTRTLQPNTFYILQMDYYKRTGNSVVRLDINGTSTGNKNDASLVAGQSPQCAWYHADTTRSNSDAFIWEDANTNILDFPQNNICYLELRGFVEFSALTNPKLIFWDVWDLANSNTDVWVDVAQYAPPPATLTWTTIPLRTNSTNYNWTRNVIDLSSYVSGYSQKRLALRFGMRANNGASPRRWYVDDIEIRDFGTKTFSICSGSSQFTCGSYWDMEDPNFILGSAQQRIDPQFVTSGRWTLDSTRALDTLGWDSGPSLRNPQGGPRIHFVEFNGLVDVTGSTPDFEGDDGAPVLSFNQAYQVKRGTRLELQWTRDTQDTTPDNWQTVGAALVSDPGGGPTVEQLSTTRTDVLLTSIPNWDTQPFRLRFAMVVASDADETSNWQIDNILIHRFDAPRFSDYPFADYAESGMSHWLPEGQWGTTAAENYTLNLCNGCGSSFTDSPNGNYGLGTNSSLILRYPIDLNNDTPENLAPEDTSNVQSAAANHPILSFWHKRDMRPQHAFYVEWSNNKGQSWHDIWDFIPGTVNSAGYINSSVSERQNAWEYVEVDLSDIQALATDPTNMTDDDVIIRFRLDARGGSNTRDGVYVDDIKIQDYSETSHKLWLQEITDPTYGAGNGTRLTDDIDTPLTYWDRWKLGGWTDNDQIQHSGLLALTDSPPRSNGNPTNTANRTYNVLTMNKIIDLRPLDANDNPTLYFWQRYNIGSNDILSVQVAAEDSSYTPTGGDGIRDDHDYERIAGWGDWQTVWTRSSPSSTHIDTWHRGAVDLRPFVASNPGKRIKIRFVYNHMNTDDSDGWYIDDVSVEQRNNVAFTLPFSDSARDMGNWVAEGYWGLAPDQWRGSGGGPANMGNNFWHGVYYDCERHQQDQGLSTLDCQNFTPSDYTNLLYTNYSTLTKRPYNPALDIEEFALEINHDFGNTGRPSGGILDPTWDDYYAARWERPISISTQSTITFITVSDDGVRLRYTGTGVPASPTWNLINNWGGHGRTVDIKTKTLNPGAYNLTLEWFEHYGSAVIIMTAGINNFSFTDTPKPCNGPSCNSVNSIQYGNSSLILTRPLDLTGTTLPILQYYTRYKMGSSTGRVEVSTNGGFDWTTTGLESNTGGFTCNSGSTGAVCKVLVPHDSNSNYWPNDPSDWQFRKLNLSPFISSGLIYIRFHLTTQTNVNDGWYVTDISVGGSLAP